MLFADAVAAKKADPAVLLKMMCPGGMVVVDNLMPEHLWTAEQRAEFSGGDPLRLFGLVITGSSALSYRSANKSPSSSRLSAKAFC